jgi:O-antigen ligase
MSPIHLFDTVFIIAFFLRLLLKKEKLYEFPYFKFFIIYLNIITFVSLHIYIKSGLIIALEFFNKSLFLPLCYYLGNKLFEDYESAKKLITIFVIAGIFPLFFIFFQKITGHIWFLRVTKGLIRSVGLYHDITSPRMFLIQMLIGVFIYWHYFLKKEDYSVKIVIFLLSIGSIVGLYFLYSKAITIVLLIWILMFSFIRGKIYVLPFAIVLILIINTLANNKIYDEIGMLFSKEFDYVRGESVQIDSLLAGRGGTWRTYLSLWAHLPFIQKAIGVGISHGGFHNDYLRLLFSGGILLLSTFIILIFMLSRKILSEFIRKRRFIHFVALLSIAYFFVESLGQLPGFYPHIHSVTWGIVGLSLNKNLKWTADK